MLKSQRSKDLNRLLNTEVGTELLGLLHEEYGGLSYQPGDQTATAFREGQRSVAIYLDEVKHDRDIQ